MEAMYTRTEIRDEGVTAMLPGEISITAVNLTAATIGTRRNDRLLRLPPLATIQTSFGLHDLPGRRFSEARLRELKRFASSFDTARYLASRVQTVFQLSPRLFIRAAKRVNQVFQWLRRKTKAKKPEIR